MILSRRSVLRGLIAAPIVCSPGLLMRVKPLRPRFYKFEPGDKVLIHEPSSLALPPDFDYVVDMRMGDPFAQVHRVLSNGDLEYHGLMPVTVIPTPGSGLANISAVIEAAFKAELPKPVPIFTVTIPLKDSIA